MEDFADVSAMFDLISTREGISPIEKLLNEFESHEAKEEQALDFYRQTLTRMPNPMTRFLMQLIISDEEKHRAVIHAMVSTLRGSLNWTRPPNSLEGSGDQSSVNGKLEEVTGNLIRLEKEGISEYKNLVKESSGYYHGVFKILLDAMIRDSEKHVELLEFLQENLRRA